MGFYHTGPDWPYLAGDDPLSREFLRSASYAALVKYLKKDHEDLPLLPLFHDNIVPLAQLCYERWVEDCELPEVGLTREQLVLRSEQRERKRDRENNTDGLFASTPKTKKNMYYEMWTRATL